MNKSKPNKPSVSHHSYVADDDEYESYTSVGVDGLLAASEKLLAINRGVADTDERDAAFNDRIYGIDRLMAERVKLDQGRTLRSLMGRLSRAKSLNPMGVEVFKAYTNDYIVGNPLAPVAEEINPMQLLEQRRRATKMGPGGVGDTAAITLDMQGVHPSQFGFIDPVAGPECFPGDHEVYTQRGWVRWDAVEDDDVFACKIDGRLEWHAAERVVREHYSGDLVVAENKTLRMAVTPHHRVIYACASGGDDLIHTAETVFGKRICIPSRHLPDVGDDSASHFQLADISNYNGEWSDKCLPDDLFSAPLTIRQRMLDTLIGYDVTQRSGCINYRRVVSARWATSVERLAIGLGYSAYIEQVVEAAIDEPCFNVHIMGDYRRVILSTQWSRQPHDGLVYCATVPGGQLHVRGKSSTSGYWTGNSEKAGIDIRLAQGTRIGSNGRVYQKVRDRRTGKTTWISPVDLLGKTLKLPD